MRVALTFDAEHPSRPNRSSSQEDLLELLASAELPATFFVQGRWATAYPATAKAIGTAGHLVGNHSHYHIRMPLLTDAGLYEDVRSAERAIIEITGRNPRPWFRCPFGATDRRVSGRLATLGYRNVLWHVDSRDWDPAETIDRIVARVVDGVRKHGDGTIVLLHSWPAVTPDATRAIARLLAADGVSFVRLDQLASPQAGSSVGRVLGS